MRSAQLLALAAAVALLGVPVQALGQDSGSPYQLPPRALADLVDRPPTPDIAVAPHGRTMLILEQPSLPPIEELAQPELRLAGRRISPRTNGPSRTSYLTRILVKDLASGVETPVTDIPADGRIGDPTWSPDGKRFAFPVTRADGMALFYAEADAPRAVRLTEYRLNAAAGAPCEWRSTSKSLVCRLLPARRGALPVAPTVPSGPVIEESNGTKAPARTYQDLLQNPHDEALFDHYFTSELAVVNLAGRNRPLGVRGVIVDATPSPDGQYVLVETLHRPYSYRVPMGSFPVRVEVWTMQGQRLAEIADLPLADNVPITFGSVRTGRRIIGWRADAPATLYWVEAADGGDIKARAEIRDRMHLLAAPFREPPTLLVELPQRFNSIRWGNDELALVSDWMWQTRNMRTLVIAPARPNARPRVLFDRSWEDRYSDPGDPVLRPTPQGTRVLAILNAGDAGDAGPGATPGVSPAASPADRSLILFGDGASPEGDRPFVDRLSLATGTSTRLWRSEAPHYETPTRLLDPTTGNGSLQVITRRESRTEPPNFFIRSLGQRGEPKEASELRQITSFPHPHPELEGLSKELIRYQRADGVKLTGTLYLPPGHVPGRDAPLPTILWAYPAEFKSADAAGQVTDSPYRFARVGWWSPLVWLVRGYAVLDDPTMPIVGEGKKEPNDTYVQQLVASARAAVDELVRRGVTDRDRIAIGGHSYGAFMTANLLAHSDLFRAGIARSGAYNRTLTPFGFQSEERTLWEAPEVYARMSPFMQANKIDEPLLLIHGEADNNPGTFPLQSQRLYQALKGLGAVARLVMLPHESHGYRARESILHLLWETDRWLELHVKNAAKRPAKPAPRRRGRPSS